MTSSSSSLSPAHNKERSMTHTPITRNDSYCMPKSSYKIKGNSTIPDNFTCLFWYVSRTPERTKQSTRWVPRTNKEMRGGLLGGLVHPNIRSHGRRRSLVAAARVRAYASPIPVSQTGVFLDVEGIPEASGLSLPSRRTKESVDRTMTHKRCYCVSRAVKDIEGIRKWESLTLILSVYELSFNFMCN